MKFLIEDGNLRGYVCVLFFIFGLSVIYAGAILTDSYFIKMIALSVGFLFMAIGGYGAKAWALHLRPFGESPWRAAKRTYDKNQENED